MKRLQAGYRQLFERYPLPMLVVDLATLRLVAANDAAAKCYGYSIRQLTDMHLPDIYFEQDQRALPAYMAMDPHARAHHRRWRHKGFGARSIEVEIDTEDMELHGLRTRMLLVNEVLPAPAATPVPGLPPQHVSSALHCVPEAFAMLDFDARFTALNPQAEALLPVGREKVVGRSLWEVFTQGRAEPYRAHFDAVSLHKQAISFEFYFELRALWLAVRAFPCSDGVAVYFLDITDAHQNRQQLEQERQRLNAIVDASNDAIIAVDPAGRMQSVNPGAVKLFGWSRDNMVGQCLNMLLPHRFRSGHGGHMAQFVASNDALRTMPLNRIKGMRSDGSEIDLEGTISQVMLGHEKVLIATLRDVTERIHAEAERQAARVQLSELAGRLMSQEKDLVKRMAQALHDQLGQTTAAIRILHDTMGVLRRGKESREYLRLDQQLGRLIDEATRQVRMVLTDLHPALLDEHGLAAALDNELRVRALRHKAMNFVLNLPDVVQDLRWPSAPEYCAFMVAREALENAVRHSRGTLVTVSLGGDEDHLELRIADNGVGLALQSTARAGHLGITGMLERARSIGAVVQVSAEPSGGTRVCLTWQPAT